MKHYILLCIVVGMTVPVGAAGDEHAPSTAAESTESVTPVREPTGPLTLQDAVALALMGSPELAPFAWQERANEAEVAPGIRTVC